MPLDFPTSPSANQIYTYGSRSWIWNGSAWDVYAIAGNFVNTLNGFTGGVTLAQGSNVTIGNSGNIITISSSGGGGSAAVTGITGTVNEVEVSGTTGNITIGLPNDVTISGNLNILGYILADGVISTKTGFQGFTGNASQEFIDYVDMDGGEF